MYRIRYACLSTHTLHLHLQSEYQTIPFLPSLSHEFLAEKNVEDKDSSSRVNTTQSYIYFTIMLNKLPNCEAYNNEIVINK